jgi:hypothetical protein
VNEAISAMNDPKIIVDHTDDETLLWEVSDEELEAFSGMGKAAIMTLYHASYCFACPA